jgi:hypothetical protein
MAEKIKPWISTCNRFVTFLDIMGFKDRLLKQNHQEVLSTLLKFSQTIKVVKQTAEIPQGFWKSQAAEVDYAGADSFVFPVMFSDSILLVSSNDSVECAHKTILYALTVFRQAMVNQIPMKGVIAHGEFTADIQRSLYFGKPIVDAFELQNELYVYGVVLHHTMEKYIMENCEADFFDINNIKNWSVPTKSGNITYAILNWIWVDSFTESNQIVSKFYKDVSGKPRKYVDNTMDFLKWLKEEKVKKEAKNDNVV